MKCKKCLVEFTEENTIIQTSFYDEKIDLQVECENCGTLNYTFVSDEAMTIDD